jgi:PAS domain-containing protein
MRTNTFAIGEVAAMLGLSPHTIRAWERRHLVVRPARTSSGHRRYSADDVDMLRQIKHERHMHGLSMRMATLTAQGLVVPEAPGEGPVAVAADVVHSGGDPLRMVADMVAEVAVSVDDRGRITHANSAFARLAERLPEQLRGVRFTDLVDAPDRTTAALACQAPVRQRRDCVLGLRTQGGVVRVSFDCWPVPAGESPALLMVGRALGAAPTGAPVTPPHAGAPAPAGTAALVRSLLDGAADPLRTLALVEDWFEATPEGVMIAAAGDPLTALLANRAMRGFGASGRPWPAPLPDADRASLAATAADVAVSGTRRAVAGLGRAAGGSEAWDVEVCPVTDAAGEVTHLALVATRAPVPSSAW